MNPELALNTSINVDTADLNSNLQLLDPDCKKTGDLITLDYQSNKRYDGLNLSLNK